MLQSILVYDSINMIPWIKSIMRHIRMVRARYGTGVFLKLNKRNCGMRIRLTPFDGDMLRIHWRIDGENYYFLASGVMGSQFSAFLSAVYGLYEEEDHSHYLHCRYNNDIIHEHPHNREDKKHCFKTKVTWDGEGPYYTITFVRTCEVGAPILDPCTPDPIQVKIESTRQSSKECTIDGRDLCYAVARGCTEALKKYGFKGYTTSTGGYYVGESFNMEKLLFVKAYGLGVLGVCNTKELWAEPNGWARAEASDFQKEMELLLFDM